MPESRARALESAGRAVAEFAATPLARKQAMLAVLLIDRAADALFDRKSGDDPLRFRDALRRADAELGLVMDLAEMRASGPVLVLGSKLVGPEAYVGLTEPDYMVGLYTGGRIERVLIALADGSRREALPVLTSALGALQHQLA